MNKWVWVAWGLLAVLWVGLIVYIGTRHERLCPPAEPVVVRLAQRKGVTEPGAVYLDFQAARAARDGLDIWLHQYGRCP